MEVVTRFPCVIIGILLHLCIIIPPRLDCFPVPFANGHGTLKCPQSPAYSSEPDYESKNVDEAEDAAALAAKADVLGLPSSYAAPSLTNGRPAYASG